MHSHGAMRRRRVLRFDGRQDRAMLAAHAGEMLLAFGGAHAVDVCPLPRDHRRAESVVEPGEVGVAGRRRNGSVEGEILLGAGAGCRAPPHRSQRAWPPCAQGLPPCAALPPVQRPRPPHPCEAPERAAPRRSISRSLGTMEKAFGGGSLATKAPSPCRVVISPLARSEASASRTTVRLTPVALTISCSVGSR